MVLIQSCPAVASAARVTGRSKVTAVAIVFKSRSTIIVACVLAVAAGCAPEVQRFRQYFAHPGPAPYQRAQAIQHDPYLLDDVGPEVVGARPREYQRPLNEVERARLAASPPPGVQALPPPTAAAVVPAPSVGAAYPAAPVPGPVVTAPAPVAVPTPLPAPAPQAAPFQYQQRPPY